MKKRTFLKFIVKTALFFIIINVKAQDVNNNIPPSLNKSFNYEQINTIRAKVNENRIDWGKNDKEGLPLWAGFSEKVKVDPKLDGTFVRWSEHQVSWLIRFQSEGTPELGIVFENVKIPANAKFFIYSDQNPNYFYLLSQKDIVSGYISTPPIPFESIIIEYVEENNDGLNGVDGSFKITEIVHIYNVLDDFNKTKDLGDSEACQVNINCSPEGDNWQKQKNGIARLLLRSGSNWYYCTGTLINNTNKDGTPYFLTAEHCGGEASATDRNVWQFYFNFERPGCENTGTPPTKLITGCTLKAKGPIDGGSDFQLLLLSTPPPIEWNPYYNGWSISTEGPTGGVGLHHPSGDAMKISTYTTTLTSATPNIGGSVMAANSAWRVNWTATENGHGVTEGGSSGSPIFNSQGLVVGTLSGGASSCSSPNLPDYYGKFDYHWLSNGTTSDKRIMPWLDPQNIGLTSLEGFSPFDNFIDFLSESFEGTSFPPPNWELQSSSSNTWKISTGYTISGETPIQINPYDGQKFAYVQWHGTQTQNEWLITPSFDFTNVNGLVLSFFFNGSYYWSVDPNNNCDLKVKAKIGNGSWSDLWREDNHGQWSTYEWHNVFLDNLSDYEGKSNVKFAFVYTGNDGANFNIDNVYIGYRGLNVDTDFLESLQVYPNPVNNTLFIENAKNIDYITISNVIGNTVYKHKLSVNKIESINFEDFESGLYIITFYTEFGKILSRKIVKQ